MELTRKYSQSLLGISNSEQATFGLKIRKAALLLFFTALLAGCKVPQIATQRPLSPVPETFAGEIISLTAH
jgi:hypothetical protein